MDHADAQCLGSAGGVDFDRLTAQDDASLVPPQRSREDLHERALAGSVLANQGMDLAPSDLESHIVEGLDAWEGLGHALHTQKEVFV